MYLIKGANDLISESLSKCVDGLHFIPALHVGMEYGESYWTLR